MQLVHIKKVKTWHGNRYAVVEKFTSSTKDRNGNIITETKDYPVEYKVGSRVEVAVFPVTEEGLEKAKELQELLNK